MTNASVGKEIRGHLSWLSTRQGLSLAACGTCAGMLLTAAASGDAGSGAATKSDQRADQMGVGEVLYFTLFPASMRSQTLPVPLRCYLLSRTFT